MWAAFWGNCVGPGTHGLTLRQRCQLMNRSVRPVLFFRNTRWPFTKSLAEEQNRVQRLMLARSCHVQPWPGEDPAFYNGRRMRIIGALAREQGAWGTVHGTDLRGLYAYAWIRAWASW